MGIEGGSPEHRELLEQFMLKRHLAHSELFAHRHHNRSPDYHREIIDDWASQNPKALTMTFRGGAKSTLAEEAIILGACFEEYKNCIIIGETYHRAVERLTAIKMEFENNEKLRQTFGDLYGSVWTENKIVLANGIVIQAFGRGQSLRGSKHLDRRPDLCFIDDFENEDSVIDELAISKSMRYLMSVVTPALEPTARIRIAGTPLHPKSVVMQLSRDPDWTKRVIPIEKLDNDGDRLSSWPDRFPLEWIDKERARYHRLGMANEFSQEYMCEAEDISTKPFTHDLIKVVSTTRTWQACYAFFDPARSVSKTSSSTGWAVWSWIGNRLIVWDAGANLWRPDQIIKAIFECDEEFRPVEIGVEKTGLNEFILQPLRQEMIRRGYSVPIRDVDAPRGKQDFIRSLQPFFRAGEIIFAKELPELTAQLLSFPAGRIDAPNALAYALPMRPGLPIYDGFGMANIELELAIAPRIPIYAIIGADRRSTSLTLAQVVNGAVHVLWDALREGDPGTSLASLVADAQLVARRSCGYYASADHFGSHDTIGLRAAARRIPVAVSSGAERTAGREELRKKLSQTVRGLPALRLASTATWTLRALAGGFAQELDKHGMVGAMIKPGPYDIVMQGLESFAALIASGNMESEDEWHYSYTSEGRRYLSALPR